MKIGTRTRHGGLESLALVFCAVGQGAARYLGVNSRHDWMALWVYGGVTAFIAGGIFYCVEGLEDGFGVEVEGPSIELRARR